MGGAAALNPLGGRWAVPRLCTPYHRLSPGGSQVVARLSSACRRTVAGLSLHCASCLWDTIGLPWGDHLCLPVGAPRESHGSPLAASWHPHGSPMAAMWQPRGSPMPATWQSHGGHMATPWRPHGSHVAAPRQPHGSPMAAPWQPGTGRKRWETIENDRKRQRTTDRER